MAMASAFGAVGKRFLIRPALPPIPLQQGILVMIMTEKVGIPYIGALCDIADRYRIVALFQCQRDQGFR